MKKRVFKIVIEILIAIIIIVNVPIVQINHQSSNLDYSNWMNDTIDDNPNIVDIKMLGAHDAFSKDITVFSGVDPYADDIIQSYVGKILKGFLVKQSVTQIVGADKLLESGVRYFDIRLTYNEEEWTTKHNFTSSGFDDIALEITNYLTEYQGEFLVLDFQHVSGLDYSSEEDYLLFKKLLEDSGLLDYNYIHESKSLGEITYNDITANKTTSKVVIIDKFSTINKETYLYETSVRSNWSDSDDFNTTMQFLKTESDYLIEHTEYNNSFRVMQAVTTIQMSPKGIVNSLESWSLIERAADFNNYLLHHENFMEINDSLPIIMVDYSNSNEESFLDNIMEIIIKENSN